MWYDFLLYFFLPLLDDSLGLFRFNIDCGFSENWVSIELGLRLVHVDRYQ